METINNHLINVLFNLIPRFGQFSAEIVQLLCWSWLQQRKPIFKVRNQNEHQVMDFREQGTVTAEYKIYGMGTSDANFCQRI